MSEDKRFGPKTESSCKSPKGHGMHMCLLMEKGMTAEIKERSTDPRYRCSNCGARANNKEDVCSPEPL